MIGQYIVYIGYLKLAKHNTVISLTPSCKDNMLFVGHPTLIVSIFCNIGSADSRIQLFHIK